MEILKIIKLQLEYYYKHWPKVNIDKLLELQDKLSVNSYYLAELYSEAYSNYLEKIYNTKTKKIKTFLSKKAEKIEDKSLTDKLAEKISEDESLSEWSAELFVEAERERLKTLLYQVNKTLDAIQQRISYLKLEKSKINA